MSPPASLKRTKTRLASGRSGTRSSACGKTAKVRRGSGGDRGAHGGGRRRRHAPVDGSVSQRDGRQGRPADAGVRGHRDAPGRGQVGRLHARGQLGQMRPEPAQRRSGGPGTVEEPRELPREEHRECCGTQPADDRARDPASGATSRNSGSPTACQAPIRCSLTGEPGTRRVPSRESPPVTRKSANSRPTRRPGRDRPGRARRAPGTACRPRGGAISADVAAPHRARRGTGRGVAFGMAV